MYTNVIYKEAIHLSVFGGCVKKLKDQNLNQFLKYF